MIRPDALVVLRASCLSLPTAVGGGVISAVGAASRSASEAFKYFQITDTEGLVTNVENRKTNVENRKTHVSSHRPR